jgi:dephospho-CoA kinase
VTEARVIGLTGGIASGKSTVARILVALVAPIVDADLVARQVVEPGSPALAELAQAFGDDIIGADGTLNRKQLGSVVFSDPEARARLNAITHPRIAIASRQAIDALIKAGERVVIYEAALIVENKLYTWMDGLIVVSVPPAVQLERLMARDGLDEAAAQSRIDAQLTLEEKRKVATHVIDNSGTLDETRARVEDVWRELTANHDD